MVRQIYPKTGTNPQEDKNNRYVFEKNVTGFDTKKTSLSLSLFIVQNCQRNFEIVHALIDIEKKSIAIDFRGISDPVLGVEIGSGS